MRLLITLTILLFSFTIHAQDDACKKAEDTKLEMYNYFTANGITEEDIIPTFTQVMTAVTEDRDFSDVLKSMLDNKTIDIKMFTATTYGFLFTKYTMICKGEYSE